MTAHSDRHLPLTRWRVLVTRAIAQAGPLNDLLHAQGAIVVQLPLVEVVIDDEYLAAIRESVSMLGHSDWTVFTSANAVVACVEAGVIELIKQGQVAAIGAATSRTLADVGVAVDFVPSVSTAAAMSVELPAVGTVFLPLAELADSTLTVGLVARGIGCDRVTVYRTTTPQHGAEALAAARSVDVMLATSPSTVDRLVETLGRDAMVQPLVCIGPTTAAAATRHGLSSVVASSPSEEGLVDAVRQTLLDPG